MPPTKPPLIVLLAAFFVASPVFAQSSAEKAICAETKLGSAIGANECYSHRVKVAERTWKKLVEKNAKLRAAKSESSEWLYEIIESEAKSWRTHLKDKCLLDVAGTAGMVQWDYAYALDCEVQGLQARIQELRKAIGGEGK